MNLDLKFKNNFLWKEKRKYSRWEAWLDLFTDAKRGSRPGYVSVDYDKLHWQWSREEIVDFLNLLEHNHMIDIVPDDDVRFHVVIHIKNFYKYQEKAEDKHKNEDLRSVVNKWAYEWELRYRTKPIIMWARDMKLAKALLSQVSKQEIFKAIERYVACDREFIKNANHSFSIFCHSANQFLVEREEYTGRTR